MNFRLAHRADVPDIVRMLADDHLGRERERVSDPLPKSYYDAFDAIEHDDNNELIVAQDGNRIVATLQITYAPSLSHQGSWRATIESVRTASDQRGHGIGTALVQFAIERARQRDCRIVQLSSDSSRVDARRFYEKLGFTASHVGMKLKLK